MTRFERLSWPSVFSWLASALLVLLLAEKLVGAAQAIGFVLRVAVVPLVVSLALAYLLQPIVHFLVKHRLPRWQASLTAILVGATIIIVLAVFALPRLGAQLSTTVQKLPAAVTSLSGLIRPRLERLHTSNPALYDRLTESLDQPGTVLEPAVGYLKNGLFRLVNLTASLLDLILIPFFLYYLLNEGPKWGREASELIPPRYRHIVEHLGSQVNGVAGNYVRGQLLVYCAMSLFYILGFLLLGVPLAFVLGILSGFGHIVPYIGPFSAAILTILLTVTDQPSLWRVIALIATYFVVQSLEGFVLTPRILGERLDLHPFLVIIGILIGGSMFGILGIILATPTIAIARVFVIFLRDLYLKSDYYNPSSDLLLAIPEIESNMTSDNVSGAEAASPKTSE